MNVAPAAVFEAVIDTGEPGLTGIGVEANDNQGSTVIAFSAGGVLEIADGVYSAVGLTAPATAGQYTLVWRRGPAGEVLGIDDLLVTYTAVAPSPGPPISAYVDIAELQRILQKPSPTVAETDAMNRVLQASAQEINWDLGYTPDNPAPAPPPPIVVDVNLDRAAELWKFNYSTVGTITVGPESTPIIAPRDTWYRHHLRLNPLRASWGVG